MDKVYIVFEEYGEYDSRERNPVKAFSDEKKADNFAEEMNKLNKNKRRINRVYYDVEVMDVE